MEKVNALVVAPYHGLNELIKRVEKDYPDIAVEILTGNLDTAVEEIKRIGVSRYDVIISRGGTATAISQHVSIPVINVGISVYDFMRAIKLSKNFSGKTALVGFANITEIAEKVVGDFLPSEVDIFTIHNRSEIDTLYRTLISKGYRTVIGDVFACDSARDFNLNTILLTSGSESVIKAFEETRHICNNLYRYQVQIKLLQTALRHTEDKVIVLDTSGTVIYNTLTFSHINLDELLQLKDTIPEDSYQILPIQQIYYSIRKTVCKIMGDTFEMLFVNRISFRAGSDSYLQIHNAADANTNCATESAVYQTYLQEYQILAEKFNAYDLPVFICGASGTGKDMLAHIIHNTSRHSKNPMITLDCSAMADENREALSAFLSDITRGETPPTLYIKHFQSLSQSAQAFLSGIVSGLQASKIRVLISSSNTIQHLLQRNPVLEPFLSAFSSHQISIAPLEKRLDQLRELVAIRINEANLRYGKQVTSLTEDTLQQLSQFPWPGNIAQLCRVIDNLVLRAEGSTIFPEGTRQLLQEEESAYQPSNSFSGKQYTLEEAMCLYIKQVLNEENNNHTKAAARLGISRSTLWRKLGNT